MKAMSPKDEVLVYKALSNAKRLEIIGMLCSGELCECEILESFNIKQPTLSFHMHVLAASHLVKCRKKGYFTKYCIDKEVLSAIIDSLKNMLKMHED